MWGKLGHVGQIWYFLNFPLNIYFLFKKQSKSMAALITNYTAQFLNKYDNIYIFYEHFSKFASPNFRFLKIMFLGKKVHRHVF